MKLTDKEAYQKLYRVFLQQNSFIKDTLKTCETLARLERTGRPFNVYIFIAPNRIVLVNISHASKAREQLVKNYIDMFPKYIRLQKNILNMFVTNYDYKTFKKLYK